MALIGAAACGKEAAPQPPVIRIAERTSDLRALQEGRTAVLRWSFPSMTTVGQTLNELETIEVWRAALPRGQEPPPPVTARDRQLQRQLLEGQGTVVAELDPEALRDATRGAELIFREDLTGWSSTSGLDPDEAVIWYGVRTICCGGRESELSNVARLLPTEPPPPPTAVELKAAAEGVEVSWRQPSELAALVERSPEGAVWTAVTDEPVRGSAFLDSAAEQGRSWSYRVRSVARPEGGGRVIGEPSAAVRIDYPDTYAPPPPAEVVCLPEGAKVRVRWEPAAGARGYTLSRRVGDGEPETLVRDEPAVEFVDDDPPLGALQYLVVAEDAAGNASEPVVCSVVMGAVP